MAVADSEGWRDLEREDRVALTLYQSCTMLSSNSYYLFFLIIHLFWDESCQTTTMTCFCSILLSCRRKGARDCSVVSNTLTQSGPEEATGHSYSQWGVCHDVPDAFSTHRVLSLLPLYHCSGCQTVSGGGLSGTTWRNPIAVQGDANLCHSTGIRCSPPQTTAVRAQPHSALMPGSHQTTFSVWCPRLGVNHSAQVDKLPLFLMKDCGACGHLSPGSGIRATRQLLYCKL